MNKFICLIIVGLVMHGCTTISDTTQNDPLAQKIDSILSKMTLEEKIGQTAQRGTSSREKGLSEELKKAVKEGRVGSLLNVMNKDNVDELQRLAVEESPNGIPLIFGRDVIHGFKTIFPIPLGQAATWNMDIVEQGARTAAVEASSAGIRWTFAPMLDIARDPRWGRIAESPGEDPYLASLIAEASVKGFQGDFGSKTSIAACAKHFAGYGAAEGGRDYNSAVIHEQLLHNVYLRPFKAAVDAGVATFMTSFNELNGVPASGNNYLLRHVLRDQWKFDGFVVSDWNSITEMIAHGYAANEKEAAEKAANAGLDMEMMSRSYENNMKELIDEGKFTVAQLDQMVRNILRIKFRLGLFDNAKFQRNDEVLYANEHLEMAKEAAIQSMVLLKNDNSVLPLDDQMGKVAVIGPMANAPHEQLGTWTFDGEKDHTLTPLRSLNEMFGEKRVLYAPGLEYSRDKTSKGFAKAIATAVQSDVILFFGGEEAILSGEAHSRARINLPGAQEELIDQLSKTGKPIVLVIMAGRPIVLKNIINKVDAILMAWHPGTMGGPAIADLLTGNRSPSGRLPVTWPGEVGQVPIYYNHTNTGRPADKESFVGIDSIPIGAWQSSLGNTSHYLDAGFTPQYPFGYGLAYTTFDYSQPKISTDSLPLGNGLTVSVEVSNSGNKEATETVQLYVQDIYASITRPVRELKQFEQVSLEPGEKKTISFELNTSALSFYNQDGEWVTEPGQFNVWIGKNAMDGDMMTFYVH